MFNVKKDIKKDARNVSKFINLFKKLLEDNSSSCNHGIHKPTWHYGESALVPPRACGYDMVGGGVDSHKPNHRRE